MSDKKNSKKQNTNQNTSTKNQSNTKLFEENTSNDSMMQDELANSKAKIESQIIEIDDWKNKALRISADLQNFQKQAELDLIQGKKSAKKNLIQNIIPFINILNISFAYAPKTDDQSVRVFIETLKSSFEKLVIELKNSNIEILTAQIGEIFNPEFMEILNSDFEATENNAKVKQVVSIGLKIDNQLIQPLSVIVE